MKPDARAPLPPVAAPADTPQCSPACCAPDDRTPDPTGAVEGCFCDE